MKKSTRSILLLLSCLPTAIYAQCDSEKKVLARGDIQGETRLVWEKQLESCLGNTEKAKELEAKLEVERQAKEAEQIEKKRQWDAKWNSFKDPNPGSETFSRDMYARALGRNKMLEEAFGDRCPVRYNYEKEKGHKFDEMCLRVASNYRYELSYMMNIWKKSAEEEPAMQASIKKANAESARLAKLPGVRIGMTASQVINNSNWGRPYEVNRTTTAHGTWEQWVYGSRNYLYFTNGILTAIQN